MSSQPTFDIVHIIYEGHNVKLCVAESIHGGTSSNMALQSLLEPYTTLASYAWPHRTLHHYTLCYMVSHGVHGVHGHKWIWHFS
jgi:hypothetical protein